MARREVETELSLVPASAVEGPSSPAWKMNGGISELLEVLDADGEVLREGAGIGEPRSAVSAAFELMDAEADCG